MDETDRAIMGAQREAAEESRKIKEYVEQLKREGKWENICAESRKRVLRQREFMGAVL